MDNDYRRAANLTITVAGVALGAYLLVKYAIRAAIPFIIALAISSLIAPLSDKISRKTKLSYRLLSALLVIAIFLSLIAVVSLAVYRLLSEAGNLMDRLSAEPEMISNAIDALTARLQIAGERLGFLKHVADSDALKKLGIDLDALLPDALRSLASSITGSLPSAAVGLAAKLPETLLFFVSLLLSSYYFCVDRQKLSDFLFKILPPKWANKLQLVREKLTDTLKGYLKAYVSIMLLTFFEVFIGLTVLRVDYAFLLSIVIAVVDILPVLGTGTILIPWAIFSFIIGKAGLGTGLLILYAVVLIVRQLTEPKIVGNTLGLHPLASLTSIYVGIKLFGLGGIFVGPITAILIGTLLQQAEASAKEETPLPLQDSTEEEK